MSTRAQIPMKPAVAPVRPLTPAPFGTLQRKCACGGSGGSSGGCEECKKKTLQRRAATTGEPATVPTIVHDVLRSPGRPLDASTRAFFEPRFGHDFSKVRIHADDKAAKSARAVDALAYTAGNTIVFAEDKYKPGDATGRSLLAHELVHVVQQAGSSDSGSHTLTPGSHPAEVEARSVSQTVAGGASVAPMQSTVSLSRMSISRQLDPHSVYCALHAAVCLGLSENPPAAAICWANFAAACGGAIASADGTSGGPAVAGAGSATPPQTAAG